MDTTSISAYQVVTTMVATECKIHSLQRIETIDAVLHAVSRDLIHTTVLSICCIVAVSPQSLLVAVVVVMVFQH
jgi:hypothetical protein